MKTFIIVLAAVGVFWMVSVGLILFLARRRNQQEEETKYPRKRPE